MRWLCLSVGIQAMLISEVGPGQSICNPCVDPPTIPRIDSPSIRRDDPGSLRVVSVADMVTELPQAATDEGASGDADASESESQAPFHLEASMDELRRLIRQYADYDHSISDHQPDVVESETIPEDAVPGGDNRDDSP